MIYRFMLKKSIFNANITTDWLFHEGDALNM